MQEAEIMARSRAVRDLMEKHLGIRAKRLDLALRKAGRRLPKHVQAAAQQIVDAERMAEVPKLARRIDPATLAAAERDVAAYLKTIDHAEERKTRLLNRLAGVAFNLLLVTVLLLVFLRWRGLV
jgi:nitrate/nitrite-specific signal transduction histidine kinase